MSNQTTPAIERAAAALLAESDEDPYQEARAALTAALTDPADPDSLAFALYALNGHGPGASARSLETSLAEWFEVPKFIREHWRAVADGLRAALLGTTS